MPLADDHGRIIRYLRVSVTDRCNFRCHYCRPRQGIPLAEHRELLTLEEILRLVGLFTRLGVSRVRLTGGEPLMRRNILWLAEHLARLPGMAELSLSTNAYLLAGYARPLRQAGVSRVNISLDSLDPDTFRQITGGGDLAPVLEGIRAAREAGLEPVKVNMVVMKGENDHEIPAMVAFAREQGVVLRFIETMPVGDAGAEAVAQYLPAEEILERVREACHSGLMPVTEVRGNGPARYFRLDNGAEVGVISAMSQHFCDHCNRVRLSSRGNLVLCLGKEDRVSLREPLRAGVGDEELLALIVEAIRRKPLRHGFARGEISGQRMVDLGG